jgi:DNA-binding NarL/FixJ family response regulator
VILSDALDGLVKMLFPHFGGVRVERVAAAAGAVRFDMSACEPSASCPVCGRMSARVHSRYRRTLTDRGVGNRMALIRLRVRRFRCCNDDCPRRIFAEQIAGLTGRYQRRTLSLTALLVEVALALGGRAGARLTRRLAGEVSRMTLLRLLRAMPVSEPCELREVGLDDFSLRRGHHYGTVVVDMRTHRPIDLLPDRNADTVAAWLAQHPSIQIVYRDRAGAYADGAARGAPQAIQVADRWRLWHNLGQAVERVVARHRAALRSPDAQSSAQPDLTTRSTVLPAPAAVAPRDRTDRVARRTRDRFRLIHDLLDQGMSLRAIATQLQLSRGTVRRFARAEHPEQLLVNNGTGYRTSLLEPYKPYLHKRWAEGATNATALAAEITTHGYTGGFTVVRDYIRRLRAAAPRQAPPTTPAPPRSGRSQAG